MERFLFDCLKAKGAKPKTVEAISLLLSIYLSIIYLSIYLPIYLSTYLSIICLSVCVSICLFLHAETILGKRFKTLAAVITFREGDWGTGMGGRFISLYCLKFLPYAY